jgi:PAS domain S-box-containing protein
VFSPWFIGGVMAAYLLILFIVAQWAERKAAAGQDVGNNPLTYTLSLSVYLTAWTFYGSVGKAANTGMLFLTVYLAPTLVMMLWWITLRKMIRIKNIYKVTSLADFISLRYNKSTGIAALVSMGAIVGIVPYIALQLKAIISTFGILSNLTNSQSRMHTLIEPVIVGFIILFTILFGARREVPTQRHQGMVAAMVVEGLFKLVALVAVGLFVTYALFGGVGPLFTRFLQSPVSQSLAHPETGSSFFMIWTTYLVLSMAAFSFLPRQFHIQTIENFHEKHIRTAMWLFPLYMLLLMLFVMPIAMGGLLSGLPVTQADTFVLRLPVMAGQPYLSLLVFLGGFSAASGMIMICAMSLSTMFTNHLMLPVIEWMPRIKFLKRYMLQCRWFAVAGIILTSYVYERYVGMSFSLVDTGMLSFAAVMQFGPSIIGGLFWKRGNRLGALWGIGAGFLTWFYTLIFPVFVKGGWLPQTFLDEGPWHIDLLRPEHLLGLNGIDPLSQAVFWTLIFNIGFYIFGSLTSSPAVAEGDLSEEFVNVLTETAPRKQLFGKQIIDLFNKKKKIKELFKEYFEVEKSSEATEQCLLTLQFDQKNTLSITELAELYHEVEKRLASVIGAAAAHQAVGKSSIVTSSEENALKQTYADMMADLKLTPSDMHRKIDYFQEREKLLKDQAAVLEKRILERDKEIIERTKAEMALRDSERRLSDLVNLLPDPTFAIDLDGKVILWNRAAEEYTGVKSSEMLGKGNYEHAVPFYGDRRPILLDLALKPSEEIRKSYPQVTIQDGIVIGENNCPTLRKGLRYLSGTAAPLYDSAGHIIGSIESVRDITDRKRIEETLQKVNEGLEHRVQERTAFLRVLLDSMPNPIFYKDTQGRYLGCNKAFESYIGYSQQSIVGKTVHEVNLSPLAEKFHQADLALLQNPGLQSYEGEVLFHDGSLHQVQFYKATYNDEAGHVAGVIGTFLDVSEIKTAQKALQQSEQKLRLLLDSLTEGIYVSDLDGKCTFINPAALRMLGYSDPGALLGKNVHPLIHHSHADGTSLAADQCRMYKAFQIGKGTHADDEVFWRFDGTSFSVEYWSYPIFEGDRITGAIATFMDISERRQAEHERSLLMTAMEQSLESIIITNADGTIVYVNSSFERLTGYARTEVMGKNPRLLHSGHQNAAFYQLMWGRLSKGNVWEGVIQNKCKNGKIMEMEETISPILDKTGHVINYVAVQRDITEKTHLQEVVRQSEKMSAVGTLAAGVAHEINNPLGIILGFAQGISGRIKTDDPISPPVHSIEREAIRCKNLVQDLLTFSRASRSELEALDLNQTVEGALSLVQAHARIIRCEVKKDFAASLPHILGNKTQVQQIVINLAKNSLDAMPDGGAVTVSTYFLSDSPQSWVCLKVADQGSGIPADVLPQIYDPFFTTKPVGQGTGLGLSLVYEIIKKHSGLITVQSQPGCTEFCVKFPAHNMQQL